MVDIDPIRIKGLRQFGKDIGKLDREMPKAIRVALNDAAEVVVGWARPRVPSRSGKARKSVRAKSTRTKVRIAGGGRRAPYYPWLDFGGRVGRGLSIERPFKREGRYLYKGYFENRDEMTTVLQRSLVRVVESTGIAID